MMAVSSELVRAARGVFLPALPALCGIIEERFYGWVGLAFHVAVDIPVVDRGCKGHPVTCAGDLLHGDCILSAHMAHERDRDLDDLRALGGKLYCSGHSKSPIPIIRLSYKRLILLFFYQFN